jgi:hypothetical protein
MRSRTAEAIDRDRAARIAALTPEERVALALRLADQGLAAFMSAHNVDRATAMTRIKATRRLGRRRSASADVNER